MSQWSHGEWFRPPPLLINSRGTGCVLLMREAYHLLACIMKASCACSVVQCEATTTSQSQCTNPTLPSGALLHITSQLSLHMAPQTSLPALLCRLAFSV